ncbi:hypothetical protein CHISP_2131 [Chitinispirillum alkaliphilum]|nr:hypothetical protein CHISP_2131 [Chitinispirillum alkaliphilum]
MIESTNRKSNPAPDQFQEKQLSGYVLEKIDSEKYYVELNDKKVMLRIKNSTLKAGQKVKLVDQNGTLSLSQSKDKFYKAELLKTDRFSEVSISNNDLFKTLENIDRQLQRTISVDADTREKAIYLLNKHSQKTSPYIKDLIQQLSTNDGSYSKIQAEKIIDLIGKIKPDSLQYSKSVLIKTEQGLQTGLYRVDSQADLQGISPTLADKNMFQNQDYPKILHIQSERDGSIVTELSKQESDRKISQMTKDLKSKLLNRLPVEVYNDILESKNRLNFTTIKNLDEHLIPYTKDTPNEFSSGKKDAFVHWMNIASEHPHLLQQLANKLPDKSAAIIPKLLMKLCSGSDISRDLESFFITDNSFESSDERQHLLTEAFQKAGYNHEKYSSGQKASKDLKALVASILESCKNTSENSSSLDKDSLIQLIKKLNSLKPDELELIHFGHRISNHQGNGTDNKQLLALYHDISQAMNDIQYSLENLLFSKLIPFATNNRSDNITQSEIQNSITELLNQVKEALNNLNDKTAHLHLAPIDTEQVSNEIETLLLHFSDEGSKQGNALQEKLQQTNSYKIFSKLITKMPRCFEQLLKSSVSSPDLKIQNWSGITNQQFIDLTSALDRNLNSFIDDTSTLIEKGIGKGIDSSALRKSAYELILKATKSSSLLNEIVTLVCNHSGSQTGEISTQNNQALGQTHPGNTAPPAESEIQGNLRMALTMHFSENTKKLTSFLTEMESAAVKLTQLIAGHPEELTDLDNFLKQYTSRFLHFTDNFRNKLETQIKEMVLRFLFTDSQSQHTSDLAKAANTPDFQDGIQTSEYREFMRQTAETLLNRLESLQLLSHSVPTGENQNQIIALPVKIGEEWNEVQLKVIRRRKKQNDREGKEISIVLNVSPSSLGECFLQLDYSNTKYLSLNFSFERAETQRWFKSKRSEILDSIQKLGFNISRLDFATRISESQPKNQSEENRSSTQTMDLKV